MKKIISYLLTLALIFIVSVSISESATATLQEKYAEAELKMANGDYAGAAELFDRMGAYSDCSQMAMYCKAISAAEDAGLYDVAIDTFTKLGEFRDCQQMVIYYTGRSYEAAVDAVAGNMELCPDNDLKTARYAADMAIDRYSELALFKDCINRIAACKEKKEKIDQELARREEAAMQSIYDKAMALEIEGKYTEAAEVYKTVKNFKDSAERIDICYTTYKKNNYIEGEKKRDEKKWEEAVAAFTRADDYSDAREQISATRYTEGLDKMDGGNYPAAATAFKQAGDYLDAREKEKEAWYLEGIKNRENKKWDDAVKAFTNADDYSDAAIQVSETRYLEASDLESNGDQEGAYQLFISLGEYKDSFERANKPYYDMGVASREAKKWSDAAEAFKHAGKYSDAPEQILLTYYTEGKDKQENRHWVEAAEAFRLAGDYSDAGEQVNYSMYQYAEALESEGNLDKSYTVFMDLGEYHDASTRARKRQYEAAEAAIAEHRYVDALFSYRRAIGYEDAYEKAVRLEKKFYDMTSYNNINNVYWFSFITADGSAYNVNYGKLKSLDSTNDGLKADFDWKSSLHGDLWIDGKTTAGAIQTVANEAALLQDGSITGCVYETKIKADWKYAKTFALGSIHFAFGIRSDGRLIGWGTEDDTAWGLVQLSELNSVNAVQIIAYDSGDDLVILDAGGQTYSYEYGRYLNYEIKRAFVLPLKNVRELTYISGENYGVYALCENGEIKRYDSTNKAWKEKPASLKLTWEEMLFDGYLLSGKVDPFDNRVINRGYLTVYADGTITIMDLVVDNGMKLWNDQTELERIFEWEAPPVDDQTIYTEAMESIDVDPSKTYKALSAMVRYPQARETINTDKRLSKIRNEEFGKGKEIELGRKDGRTPDRFTIIDQQKGRILVISNSVYEYTIDADYANVKWKDTALYRNIAEKYNELFAEAEKSLIIPLNNGDMKGEYVFCPSIQEIKKYFPKDGNRTLSDGREWISRTMDKKGMIKGCNAEGKIVDIQAENGKQVCYRLMFWIDLNQLPLDMSAIQ